MSAYTVLGRVVSRQTGAGCAGVRVEAWDKDLLVNDLVGSTLTDRTGAFQLTFDETYFRELFLDRRPDLFFRIYRADRLLRETADSVLWNVEAGTTPITIDIPNEEGTMPTDADNMPLEIPWKLAASTQPAAGTAPEGTSIALFYYEPRLPSLNEHYPDHRLMYLKVTASVSPQEYQPAAASETVRNLIEGGLPVWHLVLDLVVSAVKGTGGAAPYFHAASPTSRSMVQTGVVGAEAFDGAASGLAIGKSGSQLHETTSSHSTTETKKASGGARLDLGFIALGGGVSSVTTDVNAGATRNVAQEVETMSRQASEERRDLLSHMSQIENVLTLLTTKHIGSPYLRFSLFPRPLSSLSIDPSDPNRWYHQLLQRRSSGIEGMQDFFAVVAVPRSVSEIAFEAKLQTISLLDRPPIFPRSYDQVSVIKYLESTYPPGLPLDEVDDADVNFDPNVFKRPILLSWRVDLMNWYSWFLYQSPPMNYGDPPPFAGAATYKSLTELFLEMYERDLETSPLERGLLFAHGLVLEAKFTTSGESVQPIDSTVRRQLGTEVEFSPRVQPTPPHMRRYRGFTSAPYQYVHAVTSWNLLEKQLDEVASNLTEQSAAPTPIPSSRFIEWVIEGWQLLSPDDARNLPLAACVQALGLTSVQANTLKNAGVKDLRELADAMLDARAAEAEAVQLAKLAGRLPSGPVALPKPFVSALAPKDAGEVRSAMRRSLFSAH